MHDGWREHHLLNDYVTAMRHRIDDLDGEERAAADEWLSWAVHHVQDMNPLRQRLALPPDPEPTPEVLKPYMRGLSPYGPAVGSSWR